jgi:hypothetical protein
VSASTKWYEYPFLTVQLPQEVKYGKAGKWNDIKLYRRTLKGRFLPGEIVEADKG